MWLKIGRYPPINFDRERWFFICSICFNVCLSKSLVFPYCYTGTILDVINIKYRLITWVNDVDIDGLAEFTVLSFSMENNLNLDILQNYGGFQANSLRNLIQSNSDIDDENLSKTSSYYSPEDYITRMHDLSHCFNFISLNVQSLSAKYDKLCTFLVTLNQVLFACKKVGCHLILVLLSSAKLSLYLTS